MWVPYLVLCLECFLHSQSLWKQWWQLWSAWPVDVDLLFWTEQGTCSAESELPTLQIGCPWTAFDDHTSGAGMVLECTVIARRHARWLDTREWSLGLYWCRSWFPKTVLEFSPQDLKSSQNRLLWASHALACSPVTVCCAGKGCGPRSRRPSQNCGN